MSILEIDTTDWYSIWICPLCQRWSLKERFLCEAGCHATTGKIVSVEYKIPREAYASWEAINKIGYRMQLLADPEHIGKAVLEILDAQPT